MAYIYHMIKLYTCSNGRSISCSDDWIAKKKQLWRRLRQWLQQQSRCSDGCHDEQATFEGGPFIIT